MFYLKSYVTVHTYMNDVMQDTYIYLFNFIKYKYLIMNIKNYISLNQVKLHVYVLYLYKIQIKLFCPLNKKNSKTNTFYL